MKVVCLMSKILKFKEDFYETEDGKMRETTTSFYKNLRTKG